MKISNETKVGILATTALVLVILGVNFLRGKNIFSRNINLYCKLPNAVGLNASNPVYLYGLKVGQVDKVEIINEPVNKILVSFHIEGDRKVPAHSLARILAGGFISPDKSIDLVPSNSSELVKNYDTLQAKVEQSITEALTTAVAPLKGKVESLVGSIDTVMGSLNSILDANSARNLKGSFASLHSTLNHLESTTARISAIADEETEKRIRGILANVARISENIKNYDGAISHTIANFSSMSDTLRAINFKKVIENANHAIAQADSILDKTARGEGSLGMLLHDKAMYVNLKNASRNLDKLIYDMRANPSRYINLSLINLNRKKSSDYPGDTTGGK